MWTIYGSYQAAFSKQIFWKLISIIDYSFYLCFYFDMHSLVLVFYCFSFTRKSRFIYSIRKRLFVEFLLFEWHVCAVSDSNTQTDKVLQVSWPSPKKPRKKYVLLVSDRSCRYTIIPGIFNWQQGRDSCISKGMDLAVIKDLETQNEVQNFLTTSTSGR